MSLINDDDDDDNNDDDDDDDGDDEYSLRQPNETLVIVLF